MTSLDPVVVYQDEYEYVVTGGGVTPVASASGAASPDEVAGPSAAPQGTSGPAPAAAPAPAAHRPARHRRSGPGDDHHDAPSGRAG